LKMTQEIYDMIIIGSGPAGFTAGIYATRGGLKTLLVECSLPASQALMSDLIENYPGFPGGISGFELIEKFKNQARNFGVKFYNGKVESISTGDRQKNIWQVNLEKEVYYSLTVILAVGTRPKQLGIEGEEKFRGKGVSYCAVCDGTFFKHKDVVIVGGGDSAVSEALYLSRLASKVILVHRRSRLRAVSALAQRAKDNKRIEFIWNSVITQIYGKDKLEGISLENTVDRTQSKLACSGVFISIGYIPNTDFLAGLIKLDNSGYIITDEKMQTSSSGIFACGDCRGKPLRQVVTACGDGAVAAFSAVEYVDRIKGRAYV
jgi:thioredoxin reductase (NADPH)